MLRPFGIKEFSIPYKGEVPETPGTPGANAYTITTADFIQPASGNNVTVDVENSDWMAIDQYIFVADGGYYLVVSVPSSTSVELKNLAYLNNANPGDTVPSGSLVTAGGVQGAIGPEGPAGSGGIVFGGQAPLDSDYYLGLSGEISGVAEDVPGWIVDAETELSKITFGLVGPNMDGLPTTATAYVSTDDGASYSAIPGAIASIAPGDRKDQVTFTPFSVPALGRILVRIFTGSFSPKVSVTLS